MAQKVQALRLLQESAAQVVPPVTQGMARRYKRRCQLRCKRQGKELCSPRGASLRSGRRGGTLTAIDLQCGTLRCFHRVEAIELEATVSDRKTLGAGL